jgi:membrane-associated phospholipid phosphatase
MRGRPVVLFLFLLLHLPSISHAQTDTVSLMRTAGQDGLTVLHAAGHVFTGPTRWEAADWAKFGGLAAATGAAALLDDEWFSLMDRNNNSQSDRLSDVVVQYGDAGGLVLVGGFYVTGLLARNTWLRETGLLAGTSILMTGALNTIIKTIVGRARPYLGLGNHEFKPFTFSDDDYLSFPSGHTIVAFSISTVLSRQIDNPWATVGLYTLAAGTAWSRTYTRHHWLSDVVCGGVMSTLISNSIVSWYKRGTDDSPGLGLNIVPGPNGIAVIYSF